MKDYAKNFYHSSEWRRCRNAYYKLKHGLCERCSGPGKIVHHKKYITPDTINNVEITLNFQNLELLCQDCHNREHNEKHGVTAHGLRFNDEGELVQVDT